MVNGNRGSTTAAGGAVRSYAPLLTDAETKPYGVVEDEK